MPYIKPVHRQELDSFTREPNTAGELNYWITTEISRYLQRVGGISYAHINEVIGVLECAKLELYSRLAVGYEAMKERTNGDVYHTDASNVNIAWAGGFFEGEGCFYAHYHKPRADGSKVFRVAASLTQKNEGLLLQFRNVVKCGVVYAEGSGGMFVWKTTKVGEAKSVFNLLRPYLGERRQMTFMELDAKESGQTFRPPRPPRDHCLKGHDLHSLGRRKDGTCAECDRAYKRSWYRSQKESKR